MFEQTGTNSPFDLIFAKRIPSLILTYIFVLVVTEEGVHPTPFRTRKLSSPSPMILHNVMWESRPLPKIVRDPLAALSARGSFFVPAPPGIFLFWGRQAGAWRFEERKACVEENLFGADCKLKRNTGLA